MKHIILDVNCNSTKAICGARMPRSLSNGNSFYYRTELDLSRRDAPSDVNCSVCKGVADRLRGGVVLSHAISEAQAARKGAETE